jgi:hypothetical protein
VLAVAAISTMKVDWPVANSATMGTKLSALVALLDSAFPLSFSKTQALVDQLPGLQISRWTIATIRQGVQNYLEQAWSAHHCDRSLSSDQ